MRKDEWVARLDDFYRASKRVREESSHWRSIQKTRSRIRSLFWAWLGTCVVGAGVLAYLADRWKVAPASSNTPLFSGPPEFITLALIVALAAYLRAVRGEAIKTLDNLFASEASQPPYDDAYRRYAETRKVHLDNVVEKLSIAGPFVVWLFFVLGVRIVADAFLRLFGKGIEWSGLLLVADCVIAVWIVVAFIGLVATHRIARNRDDDLRAISRHYEETRQPPARDGEPLRRPKQPDGANAMQNTARDSGTVPTALLMLLLGAIFLGGTFSGDDQRGPRR